VAGIHEAMILDGLRQSLWIWQFCGWSVVAGTMPVLKFIVITPHQSLPFGKAAPGTLIEIIHCAEPPHCWPFQFVDLPNIHLVLVKQS